MSGLDLLLKENAEVNRLDYLPHRLYLEDWRSSSYPVGTLDVIGSITWFLFFAFVTWTEVRSVLKQNEINGETIGMAISGHLVVGLTWGMLYVILVSLQTDSFNLGATPVKRFVRGTVFLSRPGLFQSNDLVDRGLR